MPKSQYVDPNEVFKPEVIHFEDIPVNQYKKTLEEEVALYGKDELMRIYHDMRTIREFETMLNEVKTKSEYNGVAYNNPGPAHLSIGQEASAVGEAYNLDIDDLTFGSHRSHGEILAKGLSSIHKLSDEKLMEIHDVVDDAEREIERQLGVHITMHIDPVDFADPRLNEIRDTIQAYADKVLPGCNVHDLHIIHADTITFDLLLPYGEGHKEAEDDILRFAEERYNDYHVKMYVEHGYDGAF